MMMMIGEYDWGRVELEVEVVLVVVEEEAVRRCSVLLTFGHGPIPSVARPITIKGRRKWENPDRRFGLGFVARSLGLLLVLRFDAVDGVQHVSRHLDGVDDVDAEVEVGERLADRLAERPAEGAVAAGG